MTMTTLEPTMVEHLDWEPACQIPGCQHGWPPATHSVALVPCECLYLACTGCAKTLDKWGNRLLADTYPRLCHSCKVATVALLIEPLP